MTRNNFCDKFIYTHRSENHVKWHGNVEVESVIINDTDGEEHGHHDDIVTREREKNYNWSFSFLTVFVFVDVVWFAVSMRTHTMTQHQIITNNLTNLIGIAGFFLPKFVSNMNPSRAMNANCAKVTMFPHPGKSLCKLFRKSFTINVCYGSNIIIIQ